MSEESARILIVDDEKDLCAIIFRVLQKEGFSPSVAHDGESALEMIRLGIPDLVLLDMRMPGIDGMEVLKRTRELKYDLPVIMMTAYGGLHSAVEAGREGASDYLTKPVKHQDLVHSIRKALENRKPGPKQRSQAARSIADLAALPLQAIMGPSEAIKRIVREIALVAPSDFTVSIQGETGTGKELVARAIHRASLRAAHPMVPVDCGAVPESLFESEFFGHEKGAFTGAAYTKPGKFEMAQGGTLFLDEIGNLPLNSQIKLLRAIQERSFFRVGGKKPVNVDLRLVVATNQDLHKSAYRGSFSRDLFYRLNEFTILIPPLRERTEDLLHLSKRFLESTNVELGKNVKGFAPSALEALTSFDWPGNVRQLKASVRRAVLQSDDFIYAEDLLLQDPATSSCDFGVKTEDLGWLGQSLKEIVRRSTVEVEKHVLVQALRKTRGNKAKAARLLQIDYKTIHTKVKQYRIRQEDGDDTENGENGQG